MQGGSEKSGATFVAQCQTGGKHPVKTSSLLQGWGEALPWKPKSLSLDPSNLHKAGYGSLDLESQPWGGRSRDDSRKFMGQVRTARTETQCPLPNVTCIS